MTNGPSIVHATPDHDTIVARAPDVLWRLGGDRVVVRRIAGAALDLVGAAAMIWVVLEAPLKISDVHSELSDVGVAASEVSIGLDMLVQADLVVRT